MECAGDREQQMGRRSVRFGRRKIDKLILQRTQELIKIKFQIADMFGLSDRL